MMNMRKPAVAATCLGPATLVTAAFILSQFANHRCDYAVRENYIIAPESTELIQSSSIGLFCWQTTEGVNYAFSQNYYWDPSQNTARAFGILTTIFGAISWISILFAPLCDLPSAGWMCIGVTLLLTCIFECLIFALFNTAFCQILGCGLGIASKCGISACVLWFVSSLATCAAATKLEKEEPETTTAEGKAEEAKEKTKEAAADAVKDKVEGDDKDGHSSGGETEPHEHDHDDIEKQASKEEEPAATTTES